MKYKLSKYIVTTDVLDSVDPHEKKIYFSTRTGSSFLINKETYDLLEKGEFIKIEKEILNKLIDFEYIVPNSIDEFKEIMSINRKGLKDSKTLSSIIQPTSNCQLGCGYCGQVHSKNTMSDSVTDKTIERIINKIQDKKYESLKITWYGGEPLLGYSSILKISNTLQEFTKSKGIYYSGVMITNGLSLKPNIFKELYLKHNVYRFQITLDTTKEFHNKRRITKEGVETFDLIINNILNIVNEEYYTALTDRPIFIRMNIDKSNYQEVEKFIDYLSDLGLHDKVDIHFAPIVNWGQEKAGDEFGLTKEMFAELEIEWYLYAMRKGFTFGYFLPKRDYNSCMVVMEDAEVYDAFGNILPCYEFSYTPFYDKKEYKIGTLFQKEEDLTYDIPIRNWYDHLENGESYCINCNLLPVCNGACPKKWLNKEIGCPEFKLNIEDKLVLQYLMDKSNIKEII